MPSKATPKHSKSRLKKLRPILAVLGIGLIAAGAYVAAIKTGHNPVTAVTQSRCESGAFITHATNAGAVASDADTADNVTVNNQSASTTSPATRLTGPNLIPNASLDYVDGANPVHWNTNLYGDNNAQFRLVSGHDDSQTAARVEIGNYKSGDADWYYAPVEVTPGGYYQFSDYFRSNVTTRAVLGLTDATGVTSYVNLASTPASTNWAQYSVNFFVPQNVTSVVVYHPLISRGYLETDDYSLRSAQATGFKQPLVSVTFDDGWKSIHDNALPILKSNNIPSTQYIISGYLGTTKAYMSPADVYDLRQQGSEIASHTVDHPDLTTLSPKQLSFELSRAKADLTKCFGPVTDFAEPYGTYNQTTEAAMAADYATARSTDAGFNTADNTSPYELKVQNVSATTTPAQVAAWIATAKLNNAWLILVYHQVGPDNSAYARSPKDFGADMQLLRQSGVAVKTVHAAYQEIKPQLVVSSNTK